MSGPAHPALSLCNLDGLNQEEANEEENSCIASDSDTLYIIPSHYR